MYHAAYSKDCPLPCPEKPKIGTDMGKGLLVGIFGRIAYNPAEYEI
jgi:hypothetical protein